MVETLVQYNILFKLNVGSKKFYLQKKTLEKAKYKATLLYKIFIDGHQCDFIFKICDNTYFIDLDPKIFSHIINYYNNQYQYIDLLNAYNDRILINQLYEYAKILKISVLIKKISDKLPKKFTDTEIYDKMQLYKSFLLNIFYALNKWVGDKYPSYNYFKLSDYFINKFNDETSTEYNKLKEFVVEYEKYPSEKNSTHALMAILSMCFSSSITDKLLSGINIPTNTNLKSNDDTYNLFTGNTFFDKSISNVTSNDNTTIGNDIINDIKNMSNEELFKSGMDGIKLLSNDKYVNLVKEMYSSDGFTDIIKEFVNKIDKSDLPNINYDDIDNLDLSDDEIDDQNTTENPIDIEQILDKLLHTGK
jgi:hypothetical protein